MIEYCKVLLLMLMLCFLVHNSVFASGDDELRCIEKEREALLEFKKGLLDDYGFLSSWGSEEGQKECCQWQGVECSPDSGHVIALQLSSCETYPKNFKGENISNALLELNYLSHLDLSCNDFNYFGRVEIPDFIGSMEKLQYLNFNNCGFYSDVRHQLANLTNLRTLNLRFNSLEFDNLHWLSRLSTLSWLDLSFSYLKDVNSIQDILNLPSLKELHLSYCQFPDNFSINTSSTSLSVFDLSHAKLTSSSFRWLFNISTSLRSLDLSYNDFEGNIPSDFGKFAFLEHLDLSVNQLTGGIPISFGNLSHLQTLDLSYNQLTGRIPKSLRNLSRLRRLSLSGNSLSESFPELFYKLSVGARQSLEALELQRNNLHGSMPASLWQLPKLEILDVSFNSLEGTISDTNLSKLHNLKVLSLSHNSLVLRISAGWIPPFQLNVTRLANCSIGPRFPTWLRTQTNLSQMDLSNNGIADEIPKWFWDFSQELISLNLSRNLILGSIPDLPPMNYSRLDISSNNFSGPLPLSFFHSYVLSLSDNMFSGSISSICTSSYLGFGLLDLSNNQFSGQLPDCWENSTSLEVLNLSNNNFSGNIPRSLRRLSILQLHNNNLSGELPPNLMHCPGLKMLDVGGNNLRGKIPSWIGTHLPTLKVLSLGDNNFSGEIPREICYLNEIQILDLSRNFISGKLPQCLNNFTSLIQKNATFDSKLPGWLYTGSIFIDLNGYIDHVFVQWKRQRAEYTKTTVGLVKLIDLSSNNLVGSIPNEFSQLRALISLNLSRNHLSGHIIPDIGRMEMLEVLDLSRNNFSGEIPKGLAKLDGLTVLDLSNNHLSGEIPSSTQLQSFEPSAYEPNDGLCGPPLTRCPKALSHPRGKHKDVDDGFMARLCSDELYVPIVLGLIVGFWGAVGTLVLKNSWRYAYFNFFSRIRDWLYTTTMIYAGRLKRRLRNNVPN